jgi:hypothetical protein
MGVEQRREVVDADTLGADIGIQTARPSAGGDDIPERDAMSAQRLGAAA